MQDTVGVWFDRNPQTRKKHISIGKGVAWYWAVWSKLWTEFTLLTVIPRRKRTTESLTKCWGVLSTIHCVGKFGVLVGVWRQYLVSFTNSYIFILHSRLNCSFLSTHCYLITPFISIGFCGSFVKLKLPLSYTYDNKASSNNLYYFFIIFYLYIY